jgi:hypothetical protein
VQLNFLEVDVGGATVAVFGGMQYDSTAKETQRVVGQQIQLKLPKNFSIFGYVSELPALQVGGGIQYSRSRD